LIGLEGDTLPFFKDLVDRALKDVGEPVGEDVEFYVVRLLVDMGTKSLDEGPFGIRLLSSKEPVVLRSVGDGSLFLSGFFHERVVYKGLTPAYLASIGSSAYGILSSKAPTPVRPVYGEMASTFRQLQRALVGVREMCDAMGLGIGEVAVRWLQTRSPVLERRANELGLFLYQKGEA
jgi:hypothetical protein